MEIRGRKISYKHHSSVVGEPWEGGKFLTRLMRDSKMQMYSGKQRINKAVSTIKFLEGFLNTIRTNVGRLDIVIDVFEWTE